MREFCRIFGLLLYKDLLVRKRHWKMTLIVESLIPIGLVMMMQAVRDFSARSSLVIEENPYNTPTAEEDLPPVYRDLNVLYTPRSNLTKQFMENYVQECLGVLPENLRSFDTEEELLRTYSVEEAVQKYYKALAVVFHKNLNNHSLTYTIRHSGRIPNSLYNNDMLSYGYAATKMYFASVEFTQLQICLDKSFIEQSVPEPTDIRVTAWGVPILITHLFVTTARRMDVVLQVSWIYGIALYVSLLIQEMPYPAYVEENQADTLMRMVICMFMVIAFLIPLCIETNYPAKEKNIGVNVLMYMNGITLCQNLLSWLLTGVLFSALYVIPITVMFKHSFSAYGIPYMNYGNACLLCALLFTHVGHLLAFGMHVSAYFSQPRYVVLTLSILYMGSFSLQQSLISQRARSALPVLGVLFPNLLLYRLLEEMNIYETKYSGLQWRYIFTAGDAEYNTLGSVGSIWLLTILGMMVHFALANYVNALRPGKYGVSKGPFYFLQMKRKNKVDDDKEAPDDACGRANGDDFEEVAEGIFTPGIQIRDLKKSYKTGLLGRSVVHALRGISIDFYKDQITALLGHNGAGKTTLMSILTGVTSESSGDIIVNGKNIRSDIDVIRRDLGLCPQENMFFPDLNVFEQIQFFGLLKGVRKSKELVEKNVNLLLESLKLSEKKYTLPDKLSGGQKRRLCLGMALIGDASILMLDEPTSGMDPETRRGTWDILLKMRGNKTIIISTHDMEEADILGDRIAIVHTGRMTCYGTSMFLKKQYGHGNVEVTLSTKPWCDSGKVMNKFGPSAERVSVDNEKIVLRAPHTDDLPQALDQIESQKEELGVTGIDVSLITLEQVFLKVTKKEDNEEARPNVVSSSTTKLHGWRSFLQLTIGLFDKKLTYTKKDTWNLTLIMLLPLMSALLMCISNRPEAYDTSILPLSIDMYGSTKAFVAGTNWTFAEKYKEIMAVFGGHASYAVDADKNISKALLRIGKADLTDYRNNYITSAEFAVSAAGNVTGNGLYSKSAVHSVPLTVNLLTNTLIKVLAGDQHSIRVSSQRLPPTLRDTKIELVEIQSLPAVLMLMGFFFSTMAIFVIHPMQETTTVVKQLQRMTGVTSFLYWNVMLLADFFIYLFSVLVMLCGFYAMDRILDIRLYTAVEIPIILLIMIAFGLNGLLVVYIFSFSGKSRNTVLTILCLVPYGLVLSQYLLHNITLIYASESVHDLQKRIFRLIPHVSFFHGQISFYMVAARNARCRSLPDNLLAAACRVGDDCCGLRCSDGMCAEHLPYFRNFEGDLSLEESLLYLALTPLLYYCILIVLEEKTLRMIFARTTSSGMQEGGEKVDDEVKAEKRLIALEVGKIGSTRGREDGDGGDGGDSEFDLPNIPGKEESENIFLAYELSKRYGKLMAVKEVSFRVKQRECFGLLGVNGAGKSTTFRMLTGEEAPDSGLIYLKGWEMKKDRKNYLSAMGYCPQTDALLDSLNAFDHLRLFARLRGIPSERVDAEVNLWIDKLNLHACKSQPSGTYSGGNKRRLNIAMALIGEPTLVLLDEPTTGVDPAARRSLWDVVRSCQAAGQAIILTSHSMQECEALCNRLVIMVKGELVCVGASQELKNRFGAGYDIHVKLNPARSDEDVNMIKRSIESALSCDIRDDNLGLIAYHVSNTETWQKMYGTMKNLADQFSCIEDYSVSSATLEQLFMQFARAAEQSQHINDDTLPKHSASQAVQV